VPEEDGPLEKYSTSSLGGSWPQASVGDMTGAASPTATAVSTSGLGTESCHVLPLSETPRRREEEAGIEGVPCMRCRRSSMAASGMASETRSQFGAFRSDPPLAYLPQEDGGWGGVGGGGRPSSCCGARVWST
jgi:hypothetical protein